MLKPSRYGSNRSRSSSTVSIPHLSTKRSRQGCRGIHRQLGEGAAFRSAVQGRRASAGGANGSARGSSDWSAIRQFFTYRAQVIGLELKELFRIGRRSLAIGPRFSSFPSSPVKLWRPSSSHVRSARSSKRACSSSRGSRIGGRSKSFCTNGGRSSAGAISIGDWRCRGGAKTIQAWRTKAASSAEGVKTVVGPLLVPSRYWRSRNTYLLSLYLLL